MCSNTIRPHRGSEELGGVAAELDDDGDTNDTMGDNEVMPVENEEVADPDNEATQDSVRVRVIPSPNPPSRQEALEHNCTHMPYRSWCEHCVRGKAKADHHRAGDGLGASETPVVSFDYAFIGDRSVKRVKDDAADVEDESHQADDDKEEADTMTTVLVGRDAKSRVCCAIPVPQKGIDVEEWSLREGLRFLDFLGYTSLLLKSDQEVSLGALLSKMKTHRGEQTQTMTEHSPVGDSQSNGFIERTIQSVEGQIRTLRSATQSRLGRKLVPGSALFAWLIIHASTLINLYEVGKDGRVPYQRLRGRKLQADLLEFGECVHFQPLDHSKLGKAELRWMNGVFLGIRLSSGEKLVGNEDGVFKVRSVRRKLESDRWDVSQLEGISSFPWKPYQGSEDDKILIRPPIPAAPKGVSDQEVERTHDGEPAPRPFSIQRRDLINFGYTPGCPGCYASANDRRYKPHTNACRQRLEKAMLENDLGNNRMKAAREREDAYLEEKVREGDRDPNRLQIQPKTKHVV